MHGTRPNTRLLDPRRQVAGLLGGGGGTRISERRLTRQIEHARDDEGEHRDHGERGPPRLLAGLAPVLTLVRVDQQSLLLSIVA